MLAYSVLVVFLPLSLARRFHYPLISAPLPSFQVQLLSPILDFLCSLHTFDPCRSQFQVFL